MGLLTDIGPPSWHPVNLSDRNICRQIAEDIKKNTKYTLSYLALYYTLSNMVGSSLLIGLETSTQLLHNLGVIQDVINNSNHVTNNNLHLFIKKTKQELEGFKNIDMS